MSDHRSLSAHSGHSSPGYACGLRRGRITAGVLSYQVTRRSGAWGTGARPPDQDGEVRTALNIDAGVRRLRRAATAAMLIGMPNIGLVLDCADPDRLADFWAPALGYAKVGAAGGYVILADQGGSAPKLVLQRVPEPKSAKNRMHLDIIRPNVKAEAARLVGLGAQEVSPQPMSEHGYSWLLMVDPEGNEFCVCDGGAPA